MQLFINLNAEINWILVLWIVSAVGLGLSLYFFCFRKTKEEKEYERTLDRARYTFSNYEGEEIDTKKKLSPQGTPILYDEESGEWMCLDKNSGEMIVTDEPEDP